MAHKFNAALKDELDSPQRRKLFPRSRALLSLGIRRGMTVADIGCGTGFFTVPLAKMVGPDGRIFGVDISKEMMQSFKERMKKENFDNIKTMISQENKIPIGSAKVDYCFLSSLVHELRNSSLFFKELRRILKDNGRIGVVEWKKLASPLGPPLQERISSSAMKRLLVENGFRPLKTVRLGKYNYGVVASRNDE